MAEIRLPPEARGLADRLCTVCGGDHPALYPSPVGPICRLDYEVNVIDHPRLEFHICGCRTLKPICQLTQAGIVAERTKHRGPRGMTCPMCLHRYLEHRRGDG